MAAPAWPRSVDTAPLEFLVAPMGLREFRAQCWEQRPSLHRATPERAAAFAGAFDLSTLLALAGSHALQFGLDITAAKYVDGARTTPVAQVGGRARGGAAGGRGFTWQLVVLLRPPPTAPHTQQRDHAHLLS